MLSPPVHISPQTRSSKHEEIEKKKKWVEEKGGETRNITDEKNCNKQHATRATWNGEDGRTFKYSTIAMFYAARNGVLYAEIYRGWIIQFESRIIKLKSPPLFFCIISVFFLPPLSPEHDNDTDIHKSWKSRFSYTIFDLLSFFLLLLLSACFFIVYGSWYFLLEGRGVEGEEAKRYIWRNQEE